MPGLNGAAFGTTITADQLLVASRTMRWDATGYGTHADNGVPAPRTRWFLAEGVTGAFDTYVLVYNPSDTAGAAHDELQPHRSQPAGGADLHAGAASAAHRGRRRRRPGARGDRRRHRRDVDERRRRSSSSAPCTCRARPRSTRPAPDRRRATSARSGTSARASRRPRSTRSCCSTTRTPSPAEVQVRYMRRFGAPVIATYTIAAGNRLSVWTDLDRRASISRSSGWS